MDYKIKNDIKALLKMGLSQEMAELIACANNGKPELVEDTVELLKSEQDEIKEALAKAGFEVFKPMPTEGMVVTNQLKDAEPEQLAGSPPQRSGLPNGKSLVYTA